MQEHDMRGYPILLHHDTDSGMVLIDVPDLPDVVTEGATEAEAIANAAEAILRVHLAFLQREGEAIPEPAYDARSVAVAGWWHAITWAPVRQWRWTGPFSLWRHRWCASRERRRRFRREIASAICACVHSSAGSQRS